MILNSLHNATIILVIPLPVFLKKVEIRLKTVEIRGLKLIGLNLTNSNRFKKLHFLKATFLL